MQAIRIIVDREKLKEFDILESFGQMIEVILKPFGQHSTRAEENDSGSGGSSKSISEEDLFLISNYNVMNGDDEMERKVWKKYL